MDDVDSLSLGYYLVSSPDVLGDADIDPASFPSVNWILTSNLYAVLHFDYSRLVIYIFWMN